jgi:putative FmdB family regulatory protein
MPIYEYACNECGHRFDARQSWSDDPLTVCPECTGAIRRVLHPAGVIFKGSGWYVTDNRKSSGTSGESSTTSSSNSDATPSKSEKTAETKTATAADS